MANFDFKHMRPGFWLGLIAVCVCLLLGTVRCSAQTQAAVYDTIRCDVGCIQKYVSKSTAKTTKIYAVYVDKQNDVMDLIYVPKSVYDYILVCKEYDLRPKLGVRLKNGNIYSIVKLKQRIRWNK
jgi:hypothetical protein